MIGLGVATSAHHRMRGARHSIRLGGRRIQSTYNQARDRRRHRAPGPPSYPWLLEVMFGLVVVRLSA